MDVWLGKDSAEGMNSRIGRGLRLVTGGVGPVTRTFGVSGDAVLKSVGWTGSRDGEPLCDPQARRARSRVGGDLRLRGPHGAARHDLEGGPVAAGTDWLLGWADAVFGLDVEE